MKIYGFVSNEAPVETLSQGVYGRGYPVGSRNFPTLARKQAKRYSRRVYTGAAIR